MLDFIKYISKPEKQVLNDWISSFPDVPSYIVGGTVRDCILKKTISDVDIAVEKIPFEDIEQFAVQHELKAIWLDRENGVIRILPRDNEWHIDVVYISSIEEDLNRRDFTCNALAVDLKEALNGEPELIDFCGGLKDTLAHKLRVLNDNTLTEDPIRILRGIRLSATLGFSLTLSARKQIKRDAYCLEKSAGERVRDELLALLRVPDSSKYFQLMLDLGIIDILFPEMLPTLEVDQPGEQQWDVFHHSINTMDAFDFIVRKGEWPYTDKEVLKYFIWDDELADHFNEEISFGSTRHELMKMAAFLHDVSKPETRLVTPEGKIRFYGHPKKGAEVSREILKRLRFSSKETDIICRLIEHHLHPVQLSGKREEEFVPPTSRSLYRYCRDLGNEAIDATYLCLADELSAVGESLDLTNWIWHGKINNCIVEYYRQIKSAPLIKLINGNDLLNMGLKGPLIGQLLDQVRTLQSEGSIQTRSEALEYVNKILEQGQNET